MDRLPKTGESAGEPGDPGGMPMSSSASHFQSSLMRHLSASEAIPEDYEGVSELPRADGCTDDEEEDGIPTIQETTIPLRSERGSGRSSIEI